jgi:hypothetical protein
MDEAMDRRPRRPALPVAAMCTVVLLALAGCDRKPGDGPSGVSPPGNVRTPGMMGAEPGSGPATPASPGPSGAAVPAPTPEQRTLVDEGARGQSIPEGAGGATNDPLAIEREKARDLGNPPGTAARTQVPGPQTPPASR